MTYSFEKTTNYFAVVDLVVFHPRFEGMRLGAEGKWIATALRASR